MTKKDCIKLKKLYNVNLDNWKRGKCAVKFCRGKGTRSRKVCCKCEKKRHKLNDPEAYTYNFLKQNAAKRGKEWAISLEWFRNFCKETNYIATKGRTSKSMSLDRINPNFGYIEGNIRIMEFGLNSSKTQHDYDYNPLDECPF